ncbi:MAG: hypothetical protein RL134_2134 [Actinomycetota bacterium]|jgi:hypothetical protein
MSQTVTQQKMTGTRILFGINALVALTGLTIGFTLTVLGTYPSLNTDPTMLGNPDQGVLGRVFDYFTYFTIWSNILVAVISIMLFMRPDRDSFVFRVLRLDSILMITVTGIIYNVVLAGSAELQGLEVVSNLFDHILTPLVSVLVWLFVGPRGWISWRTIGAALILPIIWLLFALVRGAFIGAYPYGFLDVATFGYGAVATNVLGVVVFAIVLSLILWGIDWVIRRVSSARQLREA